MTIDGDPWFVAADVCRALTLPVGGRGTHMYLRSLAADEKCLIPRNLIAGKGMNQASLVSESGLYKFVMRSDRRTL